MSVLKMPGERRGESASSGRDAAAVSRELARLDPFSFFVIAGGRFGAAHVVVGTTGTFVIVMGTDAVDGRIRRDVARARKAARRVRREAGTAIVHTMVQPVLCLPGRQFAPRRQRGVKVIPWGAVIAEVANRRGSATPHQAQRVAEALGAIPLRVASRVS